MESKICSRCKENKTLSFYVKNKMGYLGHKSICKDCTNKNIPKKTEQERKERNKEMHRIWCAINRPRKTIKDNPFKFCCCCKKEFPKTDEFFRRRSDIKNNFRSECRNCFDEKQRKRHIEFYKNNTEKERLRHKKWASENKERKATVVHNSYLKNIVNRKNYDKKRTEELTDSRILNRICAQTSLTKDEISQELIETKRLLTQLKRELKSIK